MEERVVLRERKGFSWFDCLQQKQYNRSNITKCLSSDTQPASKLSHRPCCMGNEKFPTNNFFPLPYTTFGLHPGEFCSDFLASQVLKDNEQITGKSRPGRDRCLSHRRLCRTLGQKGLPGLLLLPFRMHTASRGSNAGDINHKQQTIDHDSGKGS